MATDATPATSSRRPIPQRPPRVKFTVRLDPRLHRRLLIDAAAHGRTSVTEHLAAVLDAGIPAYDEITSAAG